LIIIFQSDTGSIAASVRLEKTLSDEASTSIGAKLSIQAVFALQAKLWLAIGTNMGTFL